MDRMSADDWCMLNVRGQAHTFIYYHLILVISAKLLPGDYLRHLLIFSPQTSLTLRRICL